MEGKTELENAKENAKPHIVDYLQEKSINLGQNFKCLNPLHDDRHPSMSFDAKRNRVHCFSCGADYDLFDLVALETGLSGKQLFDHVYEKYNIHVKYKFSKNKEKQDTVENPAQDNREFFKKCHESLGKTDYWKKRGLTQKTLDSFNLGYWEEKRRFVIPTGISSYNARAVDDVDKKFRYLKPKGEYEIFNLKAVAESERPVFVVEGEFDALSVIEAGGNAVALGSSGNAKFMVFVRENPPKSPLILSLDNDDAGREGEAKIASELEKAGVEFVRAEISCGFKDANEALVRERENFFAAVASAEKKALIEIKAKKEKEREEYLGTSALGEIGNFIADIRKIYNRNCISTGFRKFDEVLDGGFYPGLYIFGAVSSLGKTTFALQIADNAAAKGQDVLVFSLEMGKQELISKSLSRISYRKCLAAGKDLTLATTTRNLMNGKSLETKEQADFMNEALLDYAEYAGRVFYHIGIGDIGVEQIKEIVSKHIRLTGKRPLVIIDYLQILSPYDMRATDKQNVDKSVVELKRASRDFEVPVLAISSFNRENYFAPVNLQSFKESGAIEYTSDVLMALQYKGMDYQKKDDGKYEDEKTRTARIIQLRADQEKAAEIPGKAQKIQLKILKNRNGRKGSVDFDFVPMFNCFSDSNQKEKRQKTETAVKKEAELFEGNRTDATGDEWQLLTSN